MDCLSEKLRAANKQGGLRRVFVKLFQGGLRFCGNYECAVVNKIPSYKPRVTHLLRDVLPQLIAPLDLGSLTYVTYTRTYNQLFQDFRDSLYMKPIGKLKSQYASDFGVKRLCEQYQGFEIPYIPPFQSCQFGLTVIGGELLEDTRLLSPPENFIHPLRWQPGLTYNLGKEVAS